MPLTYGLCLGFDSINIFHLFFYGHKQTFFSFENMEFWSNKASIFALLLQLKMKAADIAHRLSINNSSESITERGFLYGRQRSPNLSKIYVFSIPLRYIHRAVLDQLLFNFIFLITGPNSFYYQPIIVVQT